MADDGLTKDEMLKIEKDIAEARASISARSADLDKAKEQGRKEAEQEMKLQQELDQQRKAKDELEAKVAAQQKAIEEQQKKFQEQLDALKTTKLPVSTENPFAGKSPKSTQLTSEEINALEEASKDLFFKERGPTRGN